MTVRPAMAATASPGPRQSRRIPASAGPTRAAAASVQPVITLAAVSSSGVRTRAGRRAACGGRVTVKLSDVSGARTNTTTGAPKPIARATAPVERVCSP